MWISPAAARLIIGNEARGVSRELRAAALDVSIPTVGVESLNAAVAAGILLYEARRQRTLRAMSLFDTTPPAAASPPRRTRSARWPSACGPERLEDFIGQEHILGPGKPLRRQIERDELSSIILWGPPGVGKTTLAKLIARITRCEFIPFSAVLSGIKEIKAVMADAERLRRLGRRTILFIDEIHRFNKAQQDAFLPYVERGDIILIGATTENPSFEVISALLSRSRVYALRGAHRAGDRRRCCGARCRWWAWKPPDELLEQIAIYSNGDARQAYNTLEAAAAASPDGELDRSRRCRTPCSARCCSTTRAAKSTST